MTAEPLTPEQRSLRARLASYASWANTTDPTARTQPARDKAEARWEREVDPDQVLPDASVAARRGCQEGLLHPARAGASKAGPAGRTPP